VIPNQPQTTGRDVIADNATKAVRAGTSLVLGTSGDRIARDTPTWDLVKIFFRRQMQHVRKFRSRR